MEITKEQVLDLHQHSGVTVQNFLNKWFPEAFKIELEVGKVYKYNQWLIKVSDLSKPYIRGYGFDNEFKWNEECDLGNEPNYWKQATTEEWEAALIAEAKKRGLYDAINFSNAHTLLSNYGVSTFHKSIDQNAIWTSYGCIYYKGVWAEIIKTITKREAEKQLGCKIV